MIPIAQAEVDRVLQGGQSAPDFKFETRLEAAARERRERAAKLDAEREDAAAKGELWTVQAAIYPGRCFCMVYHGREENTDAITSQHREAGVIFGPVLLTGKQHAVMAEALAFFKVNEITIRVVGVP